MFADEAAAIAADCSGRGELRSSILGGNTAPSGGASGNAALFLNRRGNKTVSLYSPLMKKPFLSTKLYLQL